MLADPPRRKDGRCARTGCSAKLKPAPPVKGVPPSAYDGDPFCSSECCKIFHGLKTAGFSTSGVGARGSKQPTAKAIPGTKGASRLGGARRHGERI